MTQWFETELHRIRERAKRRERLQTLLVGYTYIGSALFLIGAGYLIAIRVLPDLNETETIAAIAALSGALLAVTAFALNQFRSEREATRRREAERLAGAGSFIALFNDLEATIVDYANRVAFDVDDGYAAPSNMRQALELLRETENIRQSNIAVIEEVIRIRNALMHGFSTPDIDLLNRYRNEIVRLIDLLQIKP